MNWQIDEPIVGIVIGVILVTHLHLEYRFWLKMDASIFGKYGGRHLSPEEAARRAYLAKALWLNLLILGWAAGFEFSAVLVTTFFLYAAIIAGFFGFNRYTSLQAALAAAAFLIYWSKNR